MFVKDKISLWYKGLQFRKFKLANYPKFTSFILDSDRDYEFLQSLLDSFFETDEYTYILFLNSTDWVQVVKLTKDNYSDLFYDTTKGLLSDWGYRYFYIPDLFPLVEDYVAEENLLDWTLDIILSNFDDGVYCERFDNYLNAKNAYLASEIVKHLKGSKPDGYYAEIDNHNKSCKLLQFNISDEVGDFDEYLYSVNLMLARRTAYIGRYILDLTNHTMSLWISYK